MPKMGLLSAPLTLTLPLINARQEQASMMLTSNKGFEERGALFGDEVMAAVLFDRLLHNCHITNIRGNSYRLREHQENSPLCRHQRLDDQSTRQPVKDGPRCVNLENNQGQRQAGSQSLLYARGKMMSALPLAPAEFALAPVYAILAPLTKSHKSPRHQI